MNGSMCDRVRDRIPDHVAGRLTHSEAAQVAGHLESCEECRAEAELVALLFQARPQAPKGLAEALRAGARRRGASRHPWWGLAAAAVAAVALGIGMNSRGTVSRMDVPIYVSEADDQEPLWLSDDGLIAGAPALDGLSEEELIALLEEMTTGGAA